MLTALEVFPLLLHVFVTFKLYIALGEFVATGGEAGDKVGEDERVYALALIVGAHSHKQKVYHIGMATYSAQQMIPAEWEKLAAAFAQSLR